MNIFPFSNPDRAFYIADVAGGSRSLQGGRPHATVIVEVVDANCLPVSAEKLADYLCDPYVQYVAIVRIGHYVPGNSASLTELDVTIYEKAPNGSSVVSRLNSLACTDFGQEIFVFSPSKLFFPYEAPVGASCRAYDAFRLKVSVTGGIDDMC